ncbi:hypothetical protein ACHAWF_018012 [Thalassiosira exigua]
MSAFDFDPFAPAGGAGGDGGASASAGAGANGIVDADAAPPPPPPAAVAAAAPSPLAAMNPFDSWNFGRTPKASPKSAPNGAGNGGGGGIWPGASAGPGSSQRSSSAASSSSPSQPAARAARRVVPYASHVATLETNWDPWIYVSKTPSPRASWTNGGNAMTYLIVRANAGCRVSGGVEGVLKWSRGRPGRPQLSPRGSNGDEDLGNFGSSFSFGDPGSVSKSASMDISKAPSSSSGGGGGGVGGHMRLLKTGLKKAQRSFEHGVTTLAVRADGGKNPDQVCASLHYCGGRNAPGANLAMFDAIGGGREQVGQGVQRDVEDVCLSRTEWKEFPSDDTQGSDGSLLFNIPLCVPDLSFLEAASAGNGNGDSSDGGVQLTVRLYLQSGAALLKAAAGAGLKREYLVGESAVLYSNLMRLAGGGGRQHPNLIHDNGSGGSDAARGCGTVNVPFTAGMLAEASSGPNSGYNSGGPSGRSSFGDGDVAALHLAATPRIKFGPPRTLGWSLTDPVSIPPEGPRNWMTAFQPPLDQAYVFPARAAASSGAASPTILANERATESALTLPLAAACARLFADAASVSQKLAARASDEARRGVMNLPPGADGAADVGRVDVELGIVALILLDATATQVDWAGTCGGVFDPTGGAIPTVAAKASFQPPHAVFEEGLGSGSVPVFDEEAGGKYVKGPGGTREAVSAKFRPVVRATAELLPGMMARADGRHVGSVRVEVRLGGSTVDNVSGSLSGGGGNGTAVEGVVELERYADWPSPGAGKVPVMAPAVDVDTGRRVGTFALLLRVATNGKGKPIQANGGAALPASSGLVSAMGLDTLTEKSGLLPNLDCDAIHLNSQMMASLPTAAAMRRRQLICRSIKVATMGSFLSPDFLWRQANDIRPRDAAALTERAQQYFQALVPGIPGMESEDLVDGPDVPLFQRRSPRPFRPSNSRGDALLSGIGFNVHVQSFSLDVLRDGAAPAPAGATQSVTHGAPADHARGFGGGAAGEGPVAGGKAGEEEPRGGLRRLEAKRIEIAKELDGAVSGLIGAVGEHFKSRAPSNAARQQAGAGTSRHVPPGVPEVVHYRAKAAQCAHRLHGLTWEIAARRATCFSQALGIAATSYLASLSDGGPGWQGYASVWARHGYLITFEGLLSAVGKELGMIEDASVAISMLRMVSVVLVPYNEKTATPPNGNAKRHRVPVPHSPYLRWVHLIQQGSHSKTRYRLEICLESSYLQTRMPDPLKNGAPVRFFPILFQMGVDIRQWGVNAGRGLTSQIKEKSRNGGLADLGEADTEVGGDAEQAACCSIVDDGDEDEEGAVADNEILMVLNVEGARKLNAYAHSAKPVSSGCTSAMMPPPVFDPSEQTQQIPPQPIHPCLVSLSDAIKGSAGKMEHSVLDRAATACQRLGGGSTVFCKSGKDRTAMQVTFKQALYVQRFSDRKDGRTALEDAPVSYDDVFAKSTLMRKHGNRIPICEKNAGEPKFAFNPLQRKFMPEMLRPEASLCTWSKPET